MLRLTVKFRRCATACGQNESPSTSSPANEARRRRGRTIRLAIDIPAVPYMDHSHCLLGIFDLVQDPEIADPNTPTLAAAELAAARGPRLLRKSPNGRSDSLIGRVG